MHISALENKKHIKMSLRNWGRGIWEHENKNNAASSSSRREQRKVPGAARESNNASAVTSFAAHVSSRGRLMSAHVGVGHQRRKLQPYRTVQPNSTLGRHVSVSVSVSQAQPRVQSARATNASNITR